ncbi:protein of unknown function [Nitrospira japonica]|uniref:Uncharacterized protein n=1 Tax=Nitrospira japonica TaxID=1325564 RepID=A0A1W1I5E0_9BACT|nr:protein of unknown function [Nitrospira japonica]
MLFWRRGVPRTLWTEGEESLVGKSLAVGQVTAVITGETQRIYPSALRSFELLSKRTFERVRVE